MFPADLWIDLDFWISLAYSFYPPTHFDPLLSPLWPTYLGTNHCAALFSTHLWCHYGLSLWHASPFYCTPTSHPIAQFTEKTRGWKSGGGFSGCLCWGFPVTRQSMWVKLDLLWFLSFCWLKSTWQIPCSKSIWKQGNPLDSMAGHEYPPESWFRVSKMIISYWNTINVFVFSISNIFIADIL